MTRHIVCMGVSATGKSTVGKILADKLGGYDFLEGDDLHSQVNKDRMEQGIALTDEDRAPWLNRIRDWMSERSRAGRSTVIACSALKHSYRDLLREADGRVIFIHISPPRSLLQERIAEREDHFMGADQLDDQLDTLEPLISGEDGFTTTNEGSPEEAVQEIMAVLKEDRYEQQ